MMVSLRSTFVIFLAGITVHASPTPSVSHPTDQISTRQASEIPPNALYLIEWWPNGCGNGDGTQLTGAQETLAACVNTESLFDPAPADDAAIRFLFPDDGNTYKWKAFGTNDCSQQIAAGETGQDGCFTVPKTKRVGAIIVYT